ncbi:hypothetical protein [Chroococcidiopsis sp. TS-821]|uniref:hypothetical protein n=1 Tax=Chroococcidiopsis sp. TS-821 TaxID=1378066 RepID=UPI000CEE1898|nr:hypothetical protein [Chroococcidiopsis sp. TS-821]
MTDEITFADRIFDSDLVTVESKETQHFTFNKTSEFENSKFTPNSQSIEASNNAADLLAENTSNLSDSTLEQQLLASEVDLDTLCQTFPLNSRCAGYQQTSQQQQRLLQRLQLQSDRQRLESRLLERLALAPEAPARSGFALGGKVSSLGVGIEGVGAISPNFNGRLGFNYLGFSGGFTQNQIDYDGDVQLLNATGMLDWFPSSSSGFRVTGGLLYQNNRVDAIARPAEVLEIGGFEFPLAAVGQLEGSLTFPNTIAPYIGIGYGNPVRRGSAFSFNIDLGVLFAGSPQADLQASGPVVDIITGIPVLNNLLEDAIAQEEQDIEDNLSWLGVYPVISIGVSYQF